MRARGLSVHQLAEATNVVYETIRGIVSGDRPPGKLILNEICRILEMDRELMGRMLAAEQVKRKYGAIPAQFKHSELAKIDELWPLLLPEEREHVIWLVVQLAGKKNRKTKQASSPQRIAPRAARTP